MKDRLDEQLTYIGLRSKSANSAIAAKGNFWLFAAGQDEPATFFGQWTEDLIVSSCRAASGLKLRDSYVPDVTNLARLWPSHQGAEKT